MNNLVVYTAIIGDGYKLPEAKSKGDAPFVCFTDQRNIAANGWDIEPVRPFYPGDPVRSAREIKIRAHKYLSSFGRSIYIDPSVCLTQPPDLVWDFLFSGGRSADLAFFHHSFRLTLADEFDACLEAELDDANVILEHRRTVQMHQPHLMNSKPIASGIIGRHHNRRSVSDAMELWFGLVARYSRRDQLSLLSALDQTPSIVTNVVAADLSVSPIHAWPVDGYSRPARYRTVADDRFLHGRKLLQACNDEVNSLSKRVKELEVALASKSLVSKSGISLRRPGFDLLRQRLGACARNMRPSAD